MTKLSKSSIKIFKLKLKNNTLISFLKFIPSLTKSMLLGNQNSYSLVTSNSRKKNSRFKISCNLGATPKKSMMSTPSTAESLDQVAPKESNCGISIKKNVSIHSNRKLIQLSSTSFLPPTSSLLVTIITFSNFFP